jgi:hypothetical protein
MAGHGRPSQYFRKSQWSHRHTDLDTFLIKKKSFTMKVILVLKFSCLTLVVDQARVTPGHRPTHPNLHKPHPPTYQHASPSLGDTRTYILPPHTPTCPCIPESRTDPPTLMLQTPPTHPHTHPNTPHPPTHASTTHPPTQTRLSQPGWHQGKDPRRMNGEHSSCFNLRDSTGTFRVRH